MWLRNIFICPLKTMLDSKKFSELIGSRTNPVAAGPTDAPLFPQLTEETTDWMCEIPVSGQPCTTVNIHKRTRCKKCGNPRPTESKEFARNSTIFKRSDWQCPNKSCKNVNWDWRSSCNKCGSLKPSVNLQMHKEREEKRRVRRQEEGRGGGFFDRQDVEKRNFDSEDEDVDEFGRRKVEGNKARVRSPRR